MSEQIEALEPSGPKTRKLAEKIGKLVIKAAPQDALAALQMNVARIYIEENKSSESAATCAALFGEQLARYVQEHWHAKRGRH